ncbi:MAG TPA: Crp/Fnr family transcriptional regulator, partial [Alphaproteobacteria bacterium]|nr:Crp/Fnr family transcriptional regulator [Alphaproteobacteria bacterium]
MENRFIQKLSSFSPLSAKDIAALRQATAEARNVAARTDLIREGDRPGPTFVLLEGWACRYKILPNGTRQILAFLMPGDCCDHHIGLLAEMDHGIQTVTAARVATIERRVMDALMEKHRAVERAIYVSQLIDEGTMRAWITSMGRRTSIERVAHLMCELYLRARNIELKVEPTLSLPLSQLLIA